ncbi:bifunctional DNA primase/polymerase [Actinophytocola xanthii]|nr:bifunctional DNA primase/polymerase [Actinophytocola xanthii]
MNAAMTAALRGWPVFPLSPRSKIPAIKQWEKVATTDRDQLQDWWTIDPARNVGIACGPAGLVVIDLDNLRGRASGIWGDEGVHHGREVLALLAHWAGEADPVDTYTVLTPHGEHRYFLAPTDRRLRNTIGATGRRGLGPGVDVRAWGGAVTAAGSVRLVGGSPWVYRPDPRRPDTPVPLPLWLVTRLTPAPPAPPRPIRLRFGDSRVDAYVAAAVRGEAGNVANAIPGSRAIVVFRAAYKLGGLVGADVLDEHVAEHALRDAARVHDGIDGWTQTEARRHIENGLARGRKHPRPIDGLIA